MSTNLDLIQSKTKAIFGDKLFAAPTKVAETWDWKAPTTYGHVCHGTFPIKLTDICGRKMVALADFIEFLNGETPAPTKTQQDKPKRGRPSKKSLAEKARIGGAQ